MYSLTQVGLSVLVLGGYRETKLQAKRQSWAEKKLGWEGVKNQAARKKKPKKIDPWGGEWPRRGERWAERGESNLRARWDQSELKKKQVVKSEKKGESGLEWECTWWRGLGQDTESNEKSKYTHLLRRAEFRTWKEVNSFPMCRYCLCYHPGELAHARIGLQMAYLICKIGNLSWIFLYIFD